MTHTAQASQRHLATPSITTSATPSQYWFPAFLRDDARPAGKCTRQCCSVHLLSFRLEGSGHSLVKRDQEEVCPISRGVIFQTPIPSITERRSLFPQSFTRSTNSVPCGSPAVSGDTTGLPCSTCISERVGSLLFAGGATSTMVYSAKTIPDCLPFGSSLSALLACSA